MFKSYPKIPKLIELGIGDETEDSLILSKFDRALATELGILDEKVEFTQEEKPYYDLYKELYFKGYIPRTTLYEGTIYFRVGTKGYLRKKKKTEYLVALGGDWEKALNLAVKMKKKLVIKQGDRFIFLTYHKFP